MGLSEVICLAMFAGVICLLATGFPVAFVLAGVSLAFALLGHAFGIFDIGLLGAFPQRVFDTMSGEIWIAIPLFVFMGVLLERSRIAEDLLIATGRLFGSVRGGLAVAVSIVGTLMAASTGIVGATVVTMGLLSLPAMLRSGYDARFACGSIAASGTLGQIIPPSIVLVLLGDQLSNAYQKAQYDAGIFDPESVSVNDLFAGALFPGLVLVGIYIAYQIVFSALRPAAAPALNGKGDAGGEERFEAPPLLQALVAPVTLIVAVLGSILSGIASPTEAASVGAVGALMLAAARIAPERSRMIGAGLAAFFVLFALKAVLDLPLSLSPQNAGEALILGVAALLCGCGIWGVGLAIAVLARAPLEGAGDASLLQDAMRATLRISAMIFAIVMGASLFSLVFRGFGGDDLIEAVLQALPGGASGAILAVMLVMFAMGFFLDFLEIVFIVVPIVAPVLLQMQFADGTPVSPVWLGVMMGLNLQTSFLTPPFGFALFYLRGVAPGEITTLDIYRGVVPFVVLQLLMLGVLWFLPGLATSLPELLYGR